MMQPDGTPGHLARPEGAGPWPAVVVLHEIFGLNDDTRGLADEAASRGFLSLAPDFYAGGAWPRCMRGAFRQLEARRGPFFDRIETAATWLRAREDCTGRVGAIGFCLGGGFALLAAPGGRFDAVVVNYGEVPEDADELLRGACPVLASFGAQDRSMRGRPERLRGALDGAGVPHDVRTYKNAGHGFMNRWPRGLTTLGRAMGMHPGYDAVAAGDAWARIERFLGEHLATSHEGA